MSETLSTHTDRSTLRRVGFSSFIGAMIEWYDFFLYGQAAALVFGQLFFPSEDPLVGTLAAFATFAVGFGARPMAGSSSATSATGSAASRRSWRRSS